MKVKNKVLEFDWDEGNFDKNYVKHGITQKEAEEVFLNDKSFVEPDIAHSRNEERHIILGVSQTGTALFVVFTIRGKNIRIISARKMNKKEVLKYEKAKENS